MIWRVGFLTCVLLLAFAYFLSSHLRPELIRPTGGPPEATTTGKTKSQAEFQPRLPSLNQIFSENHDFLASLSAERTRTLLATGDVMPARSVNFETERRQDFSWPYLKTQQLTQGADLTFSNLETPLLKNCPLKNEGMIFCGARRNIEGLVFAGIDVVSLANNHAGNYGEAGVKETFENLRRAGIEVTGTTFSNRVIKDVRGIKFAFLGFNDIGQNQPGVANVDEEKIKAEVAKAKGQADLAIVTFHWGVEYTAEPTHRQKYLGRLAIDSGADLVIGNHPHWIQPLEFYEYKLITYAQGNFVFDQGWSLKTKEGIVGKYTFYDRQLIDVEFFPVLIENYGQPKLLEGLEKKRILSEMARGSEH